MFNSLESSLNFLSAGLLSVGHALGLVCSAVFLSEHRKNTKPHSAYFQTHEEAIAYNWGVYLRRYANRLQ